MKVLFACNNDHERQLYRIYLENTLHDIEITECSTTDDAIQNIKTRNYNAALISESITGGTPGTVFRSLKKDSPGTIFILFGKSSDKNYPELDGYKSINENNATIKMPLSPKDFQDQVLKAISPSRSSLERVPAFQRVRLIHFYRFNKVLCNVYVKLSDRKYVKVLNTNSYYEKSQIDNYYHKGIEHFFISNNDFEKFQVSFTNQRFLEADASGMDPKDSFNAMSTTHMVLQDLITKVGFSDEAIKLAEKNINKVATMIKNNVQLSELFEKQLNDKNYLYDHGYLISVVACDIFNRLNWDTADNIQKLCSAAVLHDLTIQNPKLGTVEGMDDQKLQHFSKADIDNYLDHPDQMAKMLETIDSIPSEVIDIVRNHHETPKGDGLYNVHPSRLSKICCTFIIAHHYVQKMYEYEFDHEKHNAIVKELAEMYNQYNFQTPMNGLMLPKRDNFCKAA